MNLTKLLAFGLLAGASITASHAAVYAGTVPTQASFNTDSNLFLRGMPLSTSGTTTLEATVSGGNLQFGQTTLQFQANTYSGTQTILNPDTLVNTPVTYSITTNYSSVTVPAIGPYGLISSSGGLNWFSNDFGVSAGSITLSGSYSVSAGGEVSTGTFSYTGNLTDYYSNGTLTVNAPGTISLQGSNFFSVNTGGSSVPLINTTVGGVPVYLNLWSGDSLNVRSLVDDGSTPVTLTAIPEASTLALGALGLLGCLRRRRAA